MNNAYMKEMKQSSVINLSVWFTETLQFHQDEVKLTDKKMEKTKLTKKKCCKIWIVMKYTYSSMSFFDFSGVLVFSGSLSDENI